MKHLLTAALVLLAFTLSGCVGGGGGTTTTGDAITEELLQEYHIEMKCEFSASGQNNGLRVTLEGCSGEELVKGVVDEATFEFSGHNDNLGTVKANRESTITVQAHYPQSKQSAPMSVVYNAEDEQVETFSAYIELPTEHFGDYHVCFKLHGYKDANKWLPGVQETPSPDPAEQKCKLYKVTKKNEVFA